MSDAITTSSETDFQQAKTILAAKGKSFYWASHLLSDIHARRATRLYRFCRYLDDLVDEATSPDAAKAALKSVETAVITRRSEDAIVNDALQLIDECHIYREAILELIRGVASDLETVRIADEPELLRYCFRVAGTVGIMMCAVLDVRDPVAMPHAIDLGIAMQLTNICRDVKEDANLGRRYLPASLVGDVDPSALRSPAPQGTPRIEAALARLLEMAENYYSSGMAGLAFLPLGARSGIVVASQIYRQIGVQLKANHFAYWKARTTVSSRSKAMITARSLAMSVCTPSFWHVQAEHDAKLHRDLAGLPCAHVVEIGSHG